MTFSVYLDSRTLSKIFPSSNYTTYNVCENLRSKIFESIPIKCSPDEVKGLFLFDKIDSLKCYSNG